MKCPICGKDVELQKKQVGVDEQGTPIFHQYAICRDCKKQWDLDKQRARKAGSAKSANAAAAKRPAHEQEASDKESTAKPAPEQKEAGKPSQKPAADTSAERKGKQKPAAEAPAEGKGKQKPAVQAPAEGKGKQQAVSASERKVKQESASAEPLSEKKVNKKPVSAESSSAVKSAKKPASSEPGVEKKVHKKPVLAETSSEGKPNKKTAAPESASEGRKNRKPASGEADPVRENTGKSVPAGSPPKKPASAKTASEKEASGKPAPENSAGRKSSSEKPGMKKERPASAGKNASSSSGQPRKAAAKKSGGASGEQRYGNIPPDRVRAKKEHTVRKGYEDMLFTDPNYKPPKKKKHVPESEDRSSARGHRPASAKQRPRTKVEPEDVYEEEEDTEYGEVKARFRIPRILFGIISVVAAGFFAYGGFFTGLDGIAAGGTASAGTAFIVYGICMLISGLILIILQNRNSIVAFILPMLAYFGGAAFTFLNRKDDPMLLYCSAAGVVLGIIFLILGIISRNAGADDSEDYDDPFEDDYE